MLIRLCLPLLSTLNNPQQPPLSSTLSLHRPHLLHSLNPASLSMLLLPATHRPSFLPILLPPLHLTICLPTRVDPLASRPTLPLLQPLNFENCATLRPQSTPAKLGLPARPPLNARSAPTRARTTAAPLEAGRLVTQFPPPRLRVYSLGYTLSREGEGMRRQLSAHGEGSLVFY